MAISVESTAHGYRLGPEEGEAYWLLGMLEIVKVCGADTGGEFGLLEVTVRAGDRGGAESDALFEEWLASVGTGSPVM